MAADILKRDESSESSADEDDVRLRPRFLSNIESCNVEVIDITHKIEESDNLVNGNQHSAQPVSGKKQEGNVARNHRTVHETVSKGLPGFLEDIRKLPSQGKPSHEVKVALRLINENFNRQHCSKSPLHAGGDKEVCKRERNETELTSSNDKCSNVSHVRTMKDVTSQTTISGNVIPGDMNAIMDLIQDMINNVTA